MKQVIEEFKFKFDSKMKNKFLECCKIEGIQPKEFAERIESYLLNKKKEEMTIEDFGIILKEKKRPIYNKETIKKEVKKKENIPISSNIEIKEIIVYDRIMKKEQDLLKEKILYFSKKLKNEFIGRILCDSLTGKEELNEKSILLEGMNSEGNSILYYLENIKKDKLKELFSGQIVGINGIVENNKLKVSELITGLSIEKEKEKVINSFKVLIVNGKIKKEIKKEEYSLIISLGKNEELNGNNIIKIPSLNDSLFVFPQPKFNDYLSNPSIINLNGITFGITTLDIFNSFNLNPLLFLNQRSWYPKNGILFHKEIPFDNSVSLDFLEKIPSIFIFPYENFKQSHQYYNDILFIHPKLNSALSLSIDSKNNYSISDF